MKVEQIVFQNHEQGDVGLEVHVHAYSLYYRVIVGILTLQSPQSETQVYIHDIFLLVVYWVDNPEHK